MPNRVEAKIDISAMKSLKVFHETGEEVLFIGLMTKQRLLVVFLRHFHCIACKAHVDKVIFSLDQVNTDLTRVIFIGNGTPEMINSFKQDHGLEDIELFTDPSLRIFDVCGMNRGVGHLINVNTASKFIHLHQEGYRQGKMDTRSGSHLQMGGVLLLERPDKVLYHFSSTHLGDFDHVEGSELLEGSWE